MARKNLTEDQIRKGFPEKPAGHTSDEYRRRKGGDPYGTRERPDLPPEIRRRAPGCRVSVQRRARGKDGSTSVVSYTRRCTYDELLNQAWLEHDLQEGVLKRLQANINRELGAAEKSREDLTLERVVEALRIAWQNTMADFDRVLTPLAAWKYYDVSIRPTLTLIAEFAEDQDEFLTAAQNTIVGSTDEPAHILEDQDLMDTFHIWFGRDTVQILLDAPFDVAAFLVNPSAWTLDEEQAAWVQKWLVRGDSAPVPDPESRRIAERYGINPDLDTENIWDVLDIVAEHRQAAMSASSNPAKGVKHPAIWAKAERKVIEQRGAPLTGEDFALVSWLYQQMGGTYRGRRNPVVRDAPPEDEFPWMPAKEMQGLIPLAEEMGASEVARSEGQFVQQYIQARRHDQMDLEWRWRRHNFLKRHLGQARNRSDLWKDGQPTKRAVAMMMWAYNPLTDAQYQKTLAASLQARKEASR